MSQHGYNHFLQKIWDERARWIPMILLFCLTLLPRLHFFSLIGSDPIFQMPIIDSLEFDLWAYRILHGQFLWAEVNNHPPLYAYFVALIYRIAGYSPSVVTAVQYLMACVTAVLAFKIAQKLFNAITAWICIVLISGYWFLIYVNTFLFSENLAVFLNILLIYILVFKEDNWKKYLSAGLVFGLSGICRPQIALFSLAVVIWIFIKNISIAGKIKYCSLFLVSFVVLGSLVLWQNYRVSGEAVFRTQAGANIYMGNNPDFKGTNIYVKIGKDWDDFISSPHHHYKRDVSETESNAYFLAKTKDIIVKQPIEWGKLILSKVFSIATGREFLRTEDVYTYNFYFSKTPYALISTKLIMILAMTGLFFSVRRKENPVLVYLILAAVLLPVAFFPIKTRYLIPVMPFIIMFAAYTVYVGYVFFSDKKYVKLWAMIIFLTAFNLIANFNPLGLETPNVSETFYAIGKNYAARRLDARAEEYFTASAKVDPDNISAYNDLGLIYMNRGQYRKALDYFQTALDVDPTAIRPKLNYDLCLKHLNGNTEGNN